MTVSLVTESGSRSPAISAKALGLVRMHETNGTTQATAEDNSAILNAYFAGGWRTLGLMLELAAGGYAVWDTIVIPRIEGMTVRGAGVGDTRSELEYETYGGAPTRIVSIKPTNPCVIDYAGQGITWQGVQVQGWWHATSASTLKSQTSNHARVGILQRCGDGTVGSGKFFSPALVVCCCDVAIQWGDSALADNADQWLIGNLRTMDCRVGIRSICRQAIGSTILIHEGTRCGTLHNFERGGGDFECRKAILENGETTLLETRAQTFDDGGFTYGLVKVDGSCGASDVTLWINHQHVPDGDDEIGGNADDEDVASQFVTFEKLHQAVDATGDLIVEMRGYGRLHIDRGEQLKTAIVTCYGGTASHMHEVVIQNCRLRTGHNPSSFVTVGTEVDNPDGRVRVVLKNNSNVGNVPFGDQYKYLVGDNGVVTPTTYDPANP
jgi:hypothetical protein